MRQSDLQAQWNLSAAEESKKPQAPMEVVYVIVNVGHEVYQC